MPTLTRLASSIWPLAKSLARTVWFRDGTMRRSVMGPYASIRFAICPQMHARMIVFYGAYELEVTQLLAQIVRPGMVVGVVGAHIGIHVLYIAKLLGKNGTVFAFEPWPDNFRYLSENIKGNQNRSDLAQIVPQPAAVGAHSGMTKLSAGATDGTHHVTQQGETSSLEVPVVSLDEYCSQLGKLPDVLLIDVEGEELNVLKGSVSVLKRHTPKLILEHHGEERQSEVSNWLVEQGYVVRPLADRHIYAEAAASG